LPLFAFALPASVEDAAEQGKLDYCRNVKVSYSNTIFIATA